MGEAPLFSFLNAGFFGPAGFWNSFKASQTFACGLIAEFRQSVCVRAKIAPRVLAHRLWG
jgi:hypothetical protein